MSDYVDDAIIREAEAVARLDGAIATIKADLHWYWHWGDGQGGAVIAKLRDAVIECGLRWPFDEDDEPRAPKKAVIARTLSKAVFERDEYRCVRCGTHLDLTCDHIVPESKGGETSLANLQTMCRSCNSKKGARQE